MVNLVRIEDLESYQIDDLCSGYVRRAVIDDQLGWALFSSDGNFEFASESMSLIVEYASECGVEIKTVH
ncbi:hypothetical protein [Allorhizobium ampelinum]|uniref:hypothetical protein n=1 Tax=Allorhizobium ampelinum TaxID=3025782 RepID=UPI000B3FB2B0|nr:hypothetical protein [Allorhizobium ampelinum]NTA27416.1 hypothetical protein [Allorhizobium ampelinum]OVE94472.1 hypothetical protein B7W85_13045 [Allorhizobium ampelinum]